MPINLTTFLGHTRAAERNVNEPKRSAMRNINKTIEKLERELEFANTPRTRARLLKKLATKRATLARVDAEMPPDKPFIDPRSFLSHRRW
jgi:hypothetical protein